jgi:hypothetical protein
LLEQAERQAPLAAPYYIWSMMVGEKTYSGCHENIGTTGPGYLKMEVYGISILRLILSFPPFTLQASSFKPSKASKINHNTTTFIYLNFHNFMLQVLPAAAGQLPLHFGHK